MTTPSLPELRTRYFALMKRSVQILSLLPDPDEIDLTDARSLAHATADVKMVLAEFNKVSAELDQIGEAVASCSH